MLPNDVEDGGLDGRRPAISRGNASTPLSREVEDDFWRTSRATETWADVPAHVAASGPPS